MIRRLLYGLAVSLILVAPAFYFQPGIGHSPQIWILLGVGLLASAFQPSYGAFEASRTGDDRGTAAQIVWSVYVTQAAALLEAATLRYPESLTFDLIVCFALALMLVGLGLRTWAVWVLGRFFTWHVQVQANQTVVEKGPYRWIRHPSYTGAFLTYAGSCIFLHSWWSALLAMILLPAAFFRRIRHEERLLMEQIPGYAAYASRTKAVVPWVI